MELLTFLLVLTLVIGFFGLVGALFGVVVTYWFDRDLGLFLFSLGLIVISFIFFWLYFSVVIKIFDFGLLG